jgi:hypothetical protein
MAEKIYVGSGKKAEKFDIVNISVCLTDIPKENIFDYNGKKYVKLVVAAKKESDKFGKTHYVAIDTFEPKKKEDESSDLPF